MDYVVTKKAFYRGDTVDVGDEIDLPADFAASWAVPKKEFKPEPEKTDKQKAEEAKEGLQGKKVTKVAKKKAKKKKG